MVGEIVRTDENNFICKSTSENAGGVCDAGGDVVCACGNVAVLSGVGVVGGTFCTYGNNRSGDACKESRTA